MTVHVCNLGTTPLHDLLQAYTSAYTSRRKKQLIETELKRRWYNASFRRLEPRHG